MFIYINFTQCIQLNRYSSLARMERGPGSGKDWRGTGKEILRHRNMLVGKETGPGLEERGPRSEEPGLEHKVAGTRVGSTVGEARNEERGSRDEERGARIKR